MPKPESQNVLQTEDSTCPNGENFPLPDASAYQTENQRLQTLVTEQRALGRQYVASIRDFWRVCSGINPAARERVTAFLSQVLNVDEFPQLPKRACPP